MEKCFLHLKLFYVWEGFKKGGMQQKKFKGGGKAKRGDLIIILKRGLVEKGGLSHEIMMIWLHPLTESLKMTNPWCKGCATFGELWEGDKIFINAH